MLINKSRCLIISGLFLTCFSVYAQKANGDRLLIGELNKRMKNEIMMSTGVFFAIGESSILYGLMIQYIRRVGHSRLGLGLGYEKLLDGNKHSTVGAVGVYYPTEDIAISVLAGPTYLRQSEYGASFGMHAEIAYRIQWQGLRIGPFSELGYSIKSAHASIGIKAGFTF